MKVDVTPKGFTLIELMIVVVIVGILAAIAYPSYINQVREARRSDAQGALLSLAQYMQRFYTENGRFDQDTSGTSVNEQLPAITAEQYTLSLSAVAANTFTLQAQPNGGQVDDACGTMTYTYAGVGTPADCW